MPKKILKQLLVKYIYKKVITVQPEYQKYVDNMAHEIAAHRS